MKKIISVLLAALLLVSCFVPAGAVSVWDAFWADEQEAARGIIMQPGATESERNFSWYMDADVTACSVLIDDEPTMTDAAVFTGTIIDSYQGDKVAKVTVTELELGAT